MQHGLDRPTVVSAHRCSVHEADAAVPVWCGKPGGFWRAADLAIVHVGGPLFNCLPFKLRPSYLATATLPLPAAATPEEQQPEEILLPQALTLSKLLRELI